MWQMHITPSLWPLKCSGLRWRPGGIYARKLAKWLFSKLLHLVPKGGGGCEWHKTPMWQMHITPSLWPLKCGGQGGER